MTVATNSQAAVTENVNEDHLGSQVLGGTFRVLVDSGLIKIPQPPGTLNLPGGDPE